MGGRSSRHVLETGDRTVNKPNGVDTEYVSTPGGYCTNYVISAHYTWWNFVPVNLFEQFHHVHNLYFLGVGALQTISVITTTGGTPEMYEPLALILFVSALRAAVEDYGKHKNDKQRNNFPYQVLTKEGWQFRDSGNLEVGNIIKILEGNVVPADVLLIGSAKLKGICEIDKANLNGETALELFQSIPQFAGVLGPEKEDVARLTALKMKLEYEPAHMAFNQCRGTFELTVPNKKTEVFPIDGAKYLLLRETTLRNTSYIYGLILYTGLDTAIEMSDLYDEDATIKESYIMRRVSKFLIYMMVIQCALCLFGAFYNGFWASKYFYTLSYMKFEGNPSLSAFYSFWTWFIILSHMVPIALIVSAEIVKFAQSHFIQRDLTLYSSQINKPAKCNNSTIHEDLGLVDYIFSDKTGTLTQNKMVFRYAALVSHHFDSADKKQLSYSNECQFFGSDETSIALMVSKRNIELAAVKKTASRQGTEGSHMDSTQTKASSGSKTSKATAAKALQKRKMDGKAAVPWSTLVAPYIYRDAGDEGGESEDDLVKKKTKKENCFSKCIFQEAPKITVDEKTLKDIVMADFSASDRKEMLDALWSDLDQSKLTIPAGMTERAGIDLMMSQIKATANHPDVKVSRAHMCYRYMQHLALSNTVEPAEDKGVIHFKSSAAEEFAMVTFAQSVGFLKKSISPTVLEIKEYSPEKGTFTGKVIREEYKLMAVLGFTSKRARVTVIYQNTATKMIHVMTKGQDTFLLPLLKYGPDTDELKSAMSALARKGVRVLVAGYADLPAEWWNSRAAEFKRLINLPSSNDSEGHDDNTCKEGCEKCKEHDFFEQLEIDAMLSYLGVFGLEDQLQALVPETIEEFLTANIKVWMITGDKLGAARTIGLACNLIDPDMQPVYENDTIAAFVKGEAKSRLLEITGLWANASTKEAQLIDLFRLFDVERNKYLSVAEFCVCLELLGCVIAEDLIRNLLDRLRKGLIKPKKSEKGVTPVAQEKAKHVWGGSADPDKISEKEFVDLIKCANISLLDAVKFDVEDGINKYNAVQDKINYPVSILLSRDAFLAMFPESSGVNKVTVSESYNKQLEELRTRFFLLASKVKSVVFAQAKPAHKKKIVTEIRARVPAAITLAIGDGANDTNMIKAAHVGVGIAGIEGTAAVNAADYAIGTFRMLHTLLFVHGFWCYERMSKVVIFIFYKASLVSVAMYYFGFFSGFSGQQFFNNLIYNWYNLFYTSLPIIIIGVFDQVLPRKTVEDNAYAQRYSRGKTFTGWTFFMWILRAFIHAFTLFIIPLESYADGINDIGETHGLWFTSTIVFASVVALPNLIVLFFMKAVSALSWFAIFGGLGMFSILGPLFSSLLTGNPNLYGIIPRVFSNPTCWLLIILSLVLVLLVELAIQSVLTHLRPTVIQILRERNSEEFIKQPEDWKKNAKLSLPVHEPERDVEEIGKAESVKEMSGDDETDQNLVRIVRALLFFRNVVSAEFEGEMIPSALYTLDVDNDGDSAHGTSSARRRSIMDGNASGLGARQRDSITAKSGRTAAIQSDLKALYKSRSRHQGGDSTSQANNKAETSLSKLNQSATVPEGTETKKRRKVHSVRVCCRNLVFVPQIPERHQAQNKEKPQQGVIAAMYSKKKGASKFSFVSKTEVSNDLKNANFGIPLTFDGELVDLELKVAIFSFHGPVLKTEDILGYANFSAHDLEVKASLTLPLCASVAGTPTPINDSTLILKYRAEE